LSESKKLSGPENCHNCESDNILGPYDFRGPSVYVSIFKTIRTQAFVCVDCNHTMLFIRKGHEHKIINEAIRRDVLNK
jgi:hypothetical protein